ncbi:hypothetical protein RRF57_005270 [Xylaria bambusicola]|uniref:Uncharacterized protein n=1 Tax=Xylaria bambusicola TaxID=326684 RepID=A0AAN7YXM6_9PEZI
MEVMEVDWTLKTGQAEKERKLTQQGLVRQRSSGTPAGRSSRMGPGGVQSTAEEAQAGRGLVQSSSGLTR